jgi:hypothetical protein
MRELWEMRYLWHVPMRLDNSKLLAIPGEEPHTPTGEAVRASLAGFGLPASQIGKLRGWLAVSESRPEGLWFRSRSGRSMCAAARVVARAKDSGY